MDNWTHEAGDGGIGSDATGPTDRCASDNPEALRPSAPTNGVEVTQPVGRASTLHPFL